MSLHSLHSSKMFNKYNSFFAGKVVIVTGSSNGIGRGTAILFAKAGATVTITGRNAATLAVTKQLCLRAGAKDSEILELIGDVTDDSFLERLVSTTVEKFGRIDVLVNNAGGVSFANYGKMITDYPIAELDEMFAINVKPVLRLSQLAAPQLEKTKGAIVNVSGALHKQLSPMPCMAAAKGALDQITIQMAGSLIKKGIRVNSVNPGVVATNFAVAAGAQKEMMEQMMAAMAANPVIPLGRVGMPDDIGKIILFLADRSQSEILVGHSVIADGGVTLKSVMFPDS